MIVQERQYHECSGCGSRKMVRDEVIGCDTCRKVLDLNLVDQGKHHAYLAATVHEESGGRYHDIQCCSWACMMVALKKEPCNYFISLPLLLFDETAPGLRAADFFALLNPPSPCPDCRHLPNWDSVCVCLCHENPPSPADDRPC